MSHQVLGTLCMTHSACNQVDYVQRLDRLPHCVSMAPSATPPIASAQEKALPMLLNSTAPLSRYLSESPCISQRSTVSRKLCLRDPQPSASGISETRDTLQSPIFLTGQQSSNSSILITRSRSRRDRVAVGLLPTRTSSMRFPLHQANFDLPPLRLGIESSSFWSNRQSSAVLCVFAARCACTRISSKPCSHRDARTARASTAL